MECGNCSGSFSKDEAVPVRGTNRYSNKSVIIAHECPMCGESLSKKFTRKRNTELCGCSALMEEDNIEICSECGKEYPLNGKGGIRESWAIPASEDMVVKYSDAYNYWYTDDS